MTSFESRVKEVLREVETKARAFDKDARKMAETLADRAQVALRELRSIAEQGSREQMQLLGVEIEKLGKRLQAAAAGPKEPIQ